MINFIINQPQNQPKKYVKCSNCKVFDSISPLISNPVCYLCKQPLKEISEEEYKQKLSVARNLKEERRKRLQQNIFNNYKNNMNNNTNNNMNNNINNNINNNMNNNINNINNNINNNFNNNRHNIDNNGDDDFYDSNHRNNSSQHSSKIQFKENNDNQNNNNNINNINQNDNQNNNNNNYRQHGHHGHHGHHGIKLIGIIGGGHHGNHFMRIGRDNSSDRDQNANHRMHRKMIIIAPSGHHHHSNNQNNIGPNNNNINNNINNNQNQIIMQGNPNQRNPFQIIVQRHHVPNEIFDPNFNLYGSRFDNVFQENFSLNFRSNVRGNFADLLMGILSANRAELRKKKQKPISEENIQKLKKFKLSEKYCKKEEGGNFEKPNCCICLDEIEIGKETVLLPCGHMFHYDCCITWLKKSNTCPICRFEIK